MKLQRITFKQHPAFNKNAKATFSGYDLSQNALKVIYLIGDNGSGKTQILESIYYALAGIHKSDLDSLELTLEFLHGTQTITHNCHKKNNSSYPGETASYKVYYSPVETTFDIKDIKTVSASSVDEDDVPKNKGINLSVEIPQLLIDIKAQDDAHLASKVIECNGKVDINLNEQNLKLDRFKNAFKLMYGNTKEFKGIEVRNGAYQIIFTDNSGLDVNIKDFSTGEKQILFRVCDMLKNLSNFDNAIILIDEPETSLHPKWQQKYMSILLELFKGLEVQFIIATHSPYILSTADVTTSKFFKVDRLSDEVLSSVGFVKNSIKNPSLNLVTYRAYGIVNELLHIELFESLLIKLKLDSVTKLGNRLDNKVKIKDFVRSVKFQESNVGDTVVEKLPVYIRNAIHHGNETNRKYTEEELEESIEILIPELEK